MVLLVAAVAHASTLQTGGRALVRAYQDTSDNSPYDANQEIDSRLRLENKLTLEKQDLFFEANFEGRYLTYFTEETPQSAHLLVREAYGQLRKPHYTVGIGRQTVTWGKLDNTIILDAVNPQDYRQFILFNKQERKEPALMATYEYRQEGWNFEGIFMPFFQTTLVNFFGTDWSLFQHLKEAISGGTYAQSTKDIVNGITTKSKDRLDAYTLKNSQAGVRLRSKIKDIDYGVYYLYAYDSVPTLREQTATGIKVKKFLYEPTGDNLTDLVAAGPSSDDLILLEEHPRVHMIGFDYETVVGQYGVRGEVGYFTGKAYIRRDFSYVRKDTVMFGFGIDHTTAGDVYYNVQLIQNAILNYEDLYAQEQVDSRLTFKARKDLLRGRLAANLDSSFSFSYHDWMLNPELTYKFNNGLDASFGGFIFEGGPTSFFGKFSTQDLIYLELNYQF